MKNSLKKTLLDITAAKAIGSAINSANTSCIVWQYQRIESNVIKKLRKF